MHTLLQDLRYGVRMLVKSPGFTLVAVISLALGIGANTAIFSVVDRIFVRTLPVMEPEQLVTVVSRGENGENSSFSYPLYADYRDRNDVMSGLFAYDEMALSLSDGGQTERVSGAIVTGNFFDVLGVAPAIGRGFLPEEDRAPGTHPVAVVSYGLWQRRFGADPKLVGRNISLNGHSFTVIGVTPAEFAGVVRGAAPEVYVPMMMADRALPKWPGALNNRGMTWLNLMGRLKPGVTREQAQAALTTIAGQLVKTTDKNADPEILLGDGSKGNTAGVRELSTPLLLLLSTVGLVLLIACANVANLLLARAGSRRKEIAVRLAVGASRVRLIRQLLTESVLLALSGGALGVLLAAWLADLLAAFSPPGGSAATPLLNARLDWRVLGFTVLLSLLTGVIFGLAPAWQSSKPDLVATLKDEAASSGKGRRVTLRNALVAAQVALSLVVLVSAGLCVRSLRNLRAIDAGFDPARMVVVSVDPALNGYKDAQSRQFYDQLLERVTALPGVEAVSLARVVPLGNSNMRMTVGVEGYTPPPGQFIHFDFNLVGPGYCATMKMPLARGRDFTARDDSGAAPVVIVNETVARTYWPSDEPLGKHLTLGFGGSRPTVAEVIGVVRDSQYRNLTEAVRPAMFLPLWQSFRPDLALHVRSA